MNFYSKSKYINYKTCKKRVWLDKYKKEEATEVPKYSVAEDGIEFGKLVQGMFKNPYVIEFDSDLKKMVLATKEALNNYQVVCEASFFAKNLYCAVDILEQTNEGVNIYEVKSSSKIKKEQLLDVAFQKYVLEANGLKVKDCFIIYINSSYVLNDKLDIKEMTVCENVNSQIEGIDIKSDILECDEMLDSQDEPIGELSSACEQYNGCPFKNFCYKQKKADKDNSVINMYNFRNRFKLINNGILTMEELINNPNEKKKLSDIQKRQIEYCINPGMEDYIEKDQIKSFFTNIKFPIYFFDFESYQYMIPRFKGTKPYQQIPFQYSLHVLTEDGKIEHKEYLADPGVDFLKDITQHYIEDLGTNGSIVAYNISFEKTRIKEASYLFPEYANQLEAILDRFIDLAEVFQKGYYYNAKMKNSFSIKSVLPSLFENDKELNYKLLDEVHNGTDAQTAFRKLMNIYGEEANITRKNMLAYCCLDTWSMVKIYEKLKAID